MNGKGLLGIANKLMTKNLTNHNVPSILFLYSKFYAESIYFPIPSCNYIESHTEDEFANLWDTK